MKTIFSQTYKNWELIIVDSYSSDGAWEFLSSFNKLPNVSLEQFPPGLYASWNRCLEKCQGEYIYFATSDDTMATNFLEMMATALDEHPECDLAHSPLREIDENGQTLANWWGKESLFARSSNEMIQKKHLRLAPFDGLLHMSGSTVYHSIAQLLIRKSLFKKTGPFRTDVGSIADLGWGMKASLLSNTIHVPDTWASWRRHPSQATFGINITSPEHYEKIELMIKEAVQTTAPNLSSVILKRLRSRWSDYFSKKSKFRHQMLIRSRSLQRALFIIAELFKGSSVAKEYLKWRFKLPSDWEKSEISVVRKWLFSVGFPDPLSPID